MKEKDTMLELCIQQGYVPKTCTLNGMLVIGLINKGECPCDGCNANRDICKGKRKDYKNYDLMDAVDFLFEKEKQQRIKATIEYKQQKDKEKQERQIEHKNTSKLYRIMELDWEYRGGGKIYIKDLVEEKVYIISKINSILDMVDTAFHYILQYRIQQVHIEVSGQLHPVYDELLNTCANNKIKVDIIPFDYRPLRDDTIINFYEDELKISNLDVFNYKKFK
jgi:hypothetical protein